MSKKKTITITENNKEKLEEIKDFVCMIKNKDRVSMDEVIDYLLERDNELYMIGMTKEEDDLVNDWYVPEDININLVKRGFGIERACKMIGRADLYDRHTQTANDYPDWLAGGTEDEQNALDSWFDDIIDEIIEAISNSRHQR